jgi:3-oxoacyl-[acyl-carrier protein] reductase
VATKHECIDCQKPTIAAGAVEVCAKVVEFLAIDLSDYVTGAVIPIDGGLVCG